MTNPNDKYYANLTYAAETEAWRTAATRWSKVPTIVQATKILRGLGVDCRVERSLKAGGCTGTYYSLSTKPGRPLISLGGRAELWVVLHEGAHHLAYAEGDRGHGPVFRGFYVDLVRDYGGNAPADKLLRNFLKRNLSVVFAGREAVNVRRTA